MKCRSCLAWLRVLLLVLIAILPTITGAAKPRVIILSDIGGSEPDDKQSFIRLLLYSNELDLVGLIGANSQFGATRGDSQVFRTIIDEWDDIRPNLLVHADGWPTATYLKSVTCEGNRQVVGMAGVGEGWDTAGSQWIMAQLQNSDPRPLWVLAWGGINTLSQTLWRINTSTTLTQAQKDALVAKLRIYDIAGQDDSGAWIAHTFPDIFYIRSGKQFMSFSYRASWQGLPQQDGDLTVVKWNWFVANVVNHAPYGANYPAAQYMFEGDTPSFLYLLDNGLGVPDYPNYGSWGGRFSAEKVSPPTRYSGNDNSAYMPAYMYNDVETDSIVFQGQTYNTIFTPLWRWRYDYQNDFAARMDWTMTASFAGANHQPHAVVQGDTTTAPVVITVTAGQTVNLSAAGSSDPDGNTLSYTWWNYVGAGTLSSAVNPSSPTAAQTTVTVPSSANTGDEIHIILTLRDNGTPVLTSYRRVILYVGTGTTPTPPTVPQNLAASASGNTVNLSWSASTDNVAVVGYHIYRNGGLAATVANTSWADTGLAYSSTYSYTVAAYDDEGTPSALSSAINVTTDDPIPDTQAPSVPSGLASSNVTSSSVGLSWSTSTDNVGVAGYLVYIDGANPVDMGNVTSGTITGLTPGITYAFSVSAYDAASNESAQSASEYVTTNSTGSNLPTGWAYTDIGNVVLAGSASYSAGTFTIEGAGADIWNTADAFAFVYTTLSGDGSITARVTSQENTNGWAKCGVMMRETLDANSEHVLMAVTPAGNSSFIRRIGYAGAGSSSTNVAGASKPWWVRLVRSGNVITGYVSADGQSWTQINTATLTTGTDVYVGLAVCSHTTSALCTAMFDNVSFSGGTLDTQAPTVPAGLAAANATVNSVDLSWNASTDNVGVTGYKVYVNGAAVDVGNYTYATINGLAADTTYSFTVSAYDAVGNESAQSAAEQATTLYLPDTQAPTVPAGLATANATVDSIDISWNASTDNVGVTGYKVYVDGAAVDVGNYTYATINGLDADTTYSFTVSAYDAAGNESAQSAAVQAATLYLPDTQAPTVPAGLATTNATVDSIDLSWNASTDNVGVTGYRILRDSVQIATTTTTSYTDTGLTGSTTYVYSVSAYDAATNESAAATLPVTTEESTGALPDGWTYADIGAVGLAGNVFYAGGEFTIEASGADIWYSADAFGFAYTTLAGDGSITARVTAQENTNSYAKSGVMIRKTLDANSEHLMMAITPGGLSMLTARTGYAGAGSGSTKVTGASTPWWVRLVRSGNTITGYVSADGQSWTLIKSHTMSAGTNIYIGLAVCSHNNSTLNTTVIDNVTIIGDEW